MKRDMLCITEIIRKLERTKYTKTEISIEFKVSGYNQKTINCHIQLLKDADFIKTVITNDQEEFPTRLTWKGHKYIDQH